MHLPKYVRFQKETIPVLLSNFPYPAAGAILDANDNDPRRIWIRDCGSEEYEQETLLHEILHLVDKEMCRRHSAEQMTEFEEKFLEEFGQILFRCLYDTGLWNTAPQSSVYQMEFEFEEAGHAGGATP